MSHMKFVFALLCCCALLAASAFAVDGVVLINQNTSVNGLPGCAHSGFPIQICQSGSYKLSGNLTMSGNGTTDAIDISADNVTLDLNGFTIDASQAPSAVYVKSGKNFSISNGTITNAQEGVFSSATITHVKDLIVTNATYYGVITGTASIINTTVAMAAGARTSGIPSAGLAVTDGEIRDSRVSGATYGIDLFRGVVQSSYASANTYAIYGLHGVTVVDCSVTNNDNGLEIADGGFGHNVFSGNTTNVVSGTSMGDNVGPNGKF